MTRAPLRFLLIVLALWIGVRAAILLPDRAPELALLPEAAAETPPQRIALAAPAGTAAPVTAPVTAPASAATPGQVRPALVPPAQLPPAGHLESIAPTFPALLTQSRPPPLLQPAVSLSPPPAPPTLSAPPVRNSRWSLSAWLLVRDESGTPALAPGGTLGGSQAGARLTYALGGGFSLSARASLPLRHPAGAELAAGVDWQPVASLPVHLLAERRQRLGRDGRSAFALTLYGGAGRHLTPRLRLDAWGQAGMVGRRSRDLFADGALRLSRRVGPVELGAGAWGAAQPGASRLDAGPSLGWRLPVPRANLRLQADWRFRLAGDAMPRSGPALTVAADF